jgi:hypothetical protein
MMYRTEGHCQAAASDSDSEPRESAAALGAAGCPAASARASAQCAGPARAP